MKDSKFLKAILIIAVAAGLAFVVVWSVKTYLGSYQTEETVETGQDTINQAEELRDQINDRPGLPPEFQ